MRVQVEQGGYDNPGGRRSIRKIEKGCLSRENNLQHSTHSCT